jgi:hypothetical protein
VIAAPHLVIVGLDARPGPRLDRLRSLVAATSELGWHPDVVLLGGGELLDDLRRTVPVQVIDDRWPGAAAPVPPVPRRLRRWLRSRALGPWVVADPRAAGVVPRPAEAPTGPVIGVLPVAGDRLDAIAADDRAVLDASLDWLVVTDRQSDELAAAGRSAGVRIDPLLAPGARRAEEDGRPVLLVPTPPFWSEINHTVEVVAALASRHPSIPIHWLVRWKDDEWLARFDLERLGLEDAVRLVWPAEAPVARYRLVVRTGYDLDEPAESLDLEGAATPVVGFAPTTSGLTAHDVGPLDVDGLLVLLHRWLPDEQEIVDRRLRARADLAAHTVALGQLERVLGPVTRAT